MFLHQFPVSPLPSTAPLSVGSRHTDICLEAINSAANMEFHTHTHRGKSKSLKETSKKKIEKDRFWLISLRLSGLLSIKFVYWFLPVCRQDMWSFMFMAHWASFHMKPMTCLLEKTRAPSAVSSLRPYLSPKILGERILRLWTKRTVLLMLHIHKGDTRPYLEQIPRLRASWKADCDFSIYSFLHVKKQETCTTRIRINNIDLSLPSLSHTSGATLNSISSVRAPLATPGLISLHSWPHLELSVWSMLLVCQVLSPDCVLWGDRQSLIQFLCPQLPK